MIRMFPLFGRMSWIRLLIILLFFLASGVSWTCAFPVTRSSTTGTGRNTAGKCSLSSKAQSPPGEQHDDDTVINNNMKRQLDRREWFQQAGLLTTLGCPFIISTSTTTSSSVAQAVETTTTPEGGTIGAAAPYILGSTPEHPIVVLGAGGKTGKLCTQILAQKRLYCRAVTRSGRPTLEAGNKASSLSPFVSYAAADVSDYPATRAAIQDADGVIFAASASGKNKGGDPAHVDYLGAYNTAKACLEENVSKLVLISAGAVTRPNAAGYVALNVLTKFLVGENIMGYKAAGEQAIRNAYANAAGRSHGGYTIIRPGGLSDSEPLGASNIHISQGDVYSSDISRTDVAEVAVACLLKGKATDSCTFELNNIKGLYKTMGNLPDLPPELLHAGAPSYLDLLDGLQTDSEMLKLYSPKIVSTFAGGSDILSIDKIIKQEENLGPK